MTTAIFGLSATGKTFLASKLHADKKIHTDDYMEHGFEMSMYHCLDAAKKYQTENPSCHLIVEGVQVARMLRKGFKVDKVIVCESDVSSRLNRHRERGTKVNPGFDRTLTKIFNEWRFMDDGVTPIEVIKN